METKFKETGIGRIPEGWELLPFNDCVDKEGHTGKYQKLQTKDYLDEGRYPIIDQGQEFIAGYTNDENDIYTGSLPVTIFGDHTLTVKFVNMKFAIGADGTVPLYPNKNELTDKFFYYLIYNHKIKSEGYQRHVKYLKQKWFAIPPLSEQRKIAEILSTVDETIEKTDAIIQETQQLKKGLMQKLLTEGIGHTQFKETKIGQIPEEWDVVVLEDYVIVKGRIGWRGLKASEYTPDGPYLIANKHIINERVIWDICDHLSMARYEESPEIQLENGDVIMSKDGTIGQVALIQNLPGKATINSTMMLLRVNHSNLKSPFLYYFLQGPRFRRFIDEKISGSTISHIFQRDMTKMVLPCPPLNEQRKIADILSEVDTKIETEQAFKEELEKLKKGLMQVLLTGKVRVKV